MLSRVTTKVKKLVPHRENYVLHIHINIKGY